MRPFLARVVVTPAGPAARRLLAPAEEDATPLAPAPGGPAEPDAVVEVAPPAGPGPAPWTLVAHAGTARAALYGLLERYGVDPAYPEAVHAEVAAHLAAPGLDDPALSDERHVPYVTIDNPDSRDLDQAVHVAREGDGYLVRYALADASWYVRPGSALFEEALARGTSFYLPSLHVPMLPPALSEGLVSLNPGVDRRALVFALSLDAAGRPRGTRLSRALVRSRAKLSYPGVQALYDDPAASPLRGAPWEESLALLRVVGRLRLADARERDVVELERAEMALSFTDADGTTLRAEEAPRLPVERYNEHVSLLCNTEGARLLAGAVGRRPDVQPVFRVHDAPPPERLEDLARTLRAVAAAQGLPARAWAWRARGPDRESLADYVARLPRDAGHARVRAALERQVRLTNVASLFAAAPGRHHALAVDSYARFSAPMREIAGIFTHKEALEQLGLCARAGADEADEALRAQVIEAANAAKQRQAALDKEAYKLAIDALLRADLALPPGRRPARAATVLGVVPSRLYVRLDDPPLELKVYAQDLAAAGGGACEPALDGAALRLGDGRLLRIGDGLALRVDGYDAKRDRWRLVPVAT